MGSSLVVPSGVETLTGDSLFAGEKGVPCGVSRSESMLCMLVPLLSGVYRLKSVILRLFSAASLASLKANWLALDAS